MLYNGAPRGFESFSVCVLCATIDYRIAVNKVSEMLALGDQPDRIAEKLGVPEETEDFK